MKLTALQVFNASQTLSQIVAANRGFPVKAAYRLARLNAKLHAEFAPIEQQRNAIIMSYGHANAAGVIAVPDDKMADFREKWAEIGAETVELDVEPIPLDTLDPGCVPGLLTVQELIDLGDLVAE